MAREIDLDRASWNNQAIASFAVAFCQVNGVKAPKTEWFDPIEVERTMAAVTLKIAPRTAKLFLRLLEERKLPSWAIGMVDIDLMRMAAHG